MKTHSKFGVPDCGRCNILKPMNSSSTSTIVVPFPRSALKSILWHFSRAFFFRSIFLKVTVVIFELRFACVITFPIPFLAMTLPVGPTRLSKNRLTSLRSVSCGRLLMRIVRPFEVEGPMMEARCRTVRLTVHFDVFFLYLRELFILICKRGVATLTL